MNSFNRQTISAAFLLTVLYMFGFLTYSRKWNQVVSFLSTSSCCNFTIEWKELHKGLFLLHSDFGFHIRVFFSAFGCKRLEIASERSHPNWIRSEVLIFIQIWIPNGRSRTKEANQDNASNKTNGPATIFLSWLAS